MYLRALFCALLALALPAFAITASQRNPVSVSVAHYPNVVQIDCATGRGSGFLTERGWVSVAHVTSNFGCSINGTPIGATPEDGLDFSRVDYAIPKGLRPLKIDCSGYHAGQWYWAVGYAGGYTWQTMTRHLATYKDSPDGMRLLLGSPTVIPGMSGGVVMNSAGEAVGTVNAYSRDYPVSFSRALKDTSLCK